MDWLNYHHLYYFWTIAKEGNVTRAAAKLRLSQSNLSGQLKALEERLGRPLFERKNRRLQLTESGQVALDYAESIFNSGKELVDFFENRPIDRKRVVVRVGALSSLSKNLQIELIKPLLKRPDVHVVLIEGSLNELLRQLHNHSLDLVVSNMRARPEGDTPLYNHELAETPIYLAGAPSFLKHMKDYPRCLERIPLFVPTAQSRIRADFDSWVAQQQIRPLIKAEVEDMALLRLFALTGEGVSVVPEIVVRNEVQDHRIRLLKQIPTLRENFYAITPNRLVPNSLVESLVREAGSRIRKPR